ncbi:histidine kinase [Marseilla massiliensis]|nr:histidine kinase [Marseilla massiliensis]MCL1611186.1 histidine kinase [Marseilla massiliensis]
MQAKLNALKQQVDPHFMFNNFSILTELIMEDSRLAVKFLGKLSKV